MDPSHPLLVVKTSTGVPIDDGPLRGRALPLDPPHTDASGHRGEGTARLAILDHAIIPVVGARRDEPPGVGGEEAIIVPQIEPLRVPLGVIRH